MKRYKIVEAYKSGSGQWEESLRQLQEIISSSNIKETVKWGSPVYTFGDKNLVGMGAFKSYVALWFFQGALLDDKKNKLVNAQEGVTKALRQWRFYSKEEILEENELIRMYLEESILNQEQGREIKPMKNKPLLIPEELLEVFIENEKMKNSFEAYSLTKKREFSDYITEAKRTETKQKRLDKITPMILEGKGLYDKYKK